MTTDPTCIVNDQPTDTDALDFTPYVETLADIIQFERGKLSPIELARADELIKEKYGHPNWTERV